MMTEEKATIQMSTAGTGVVDGLAGSHTTDGQHSYPPIPQATSHEINITHISHSQLAETRFLRRARMFTAFVALFLAGWNGGATGALIPTIEKTYALSYAKVSILFITTFIGYLVAAMSTGFLTRRIGFGRAFLAGALVGLAGTVINACQHTSFGVLAFGYFVVALGFAIQIGLCNTYFSAVFDHPLMWLGVLHGVYGLGAFASPLVATVFVKKEIPYNLFYVTNIPQNIIVLGLATIYFAPLKQLPQTTVVETTGPGVAHSKITIFTALKYRAVWTLSLFLMFYSGAEESLGGWIVSYVLSARNGSASNASWVASSFYLGLALGRIILPALNIFIGERRAVFMFLLLAIALEIVAWRIPILTSTATATALVGVAISTFYSATITAGGRLIPRAIHADAFSLIASVGTSGSALWPLVVGLVSTKQGIWVLEPIVLGLLGAQGVMWALVPTVERRSV